MKFSISSINPTDPTIGENTLQNLTVYEPSENLVKSDRSLNLPPPRPFQDSIDLDSSNPIPSLPKPSPIKANSLSPDRINALVSGYSWTVPSSRVITYSFYESSVWGGSYYGSETGVTEVNEAVKSNVRQILNWLETVINIDFQEVIESSTTASVGTLRYMISNNPGYAYAYYPTSSQVGGDVHLNPAWVNQSSPDGGGFDAAAGTYGYQALIHETGHALGLKHTHETPSLPTVEDNTANTVMSYRDTSSYTLVGNNYIIENSAATAMAYDIGALQSLYGTKAKEAGNTVYQFTTRIDQFSVNSVLSINTLRSLKQTIWDTGGIDTLDFTNLAFESGGYRLDMNEGGWLTANSSYHYLASLDDPNVTGGTITSTYFDRGTAIAYDVTLENIINSTSSDTIYANDAANTFRGYTSGRSVGTDVLWNTSSSDTLDLSAYSFNAVTRTQTANDLVLGLGSNGSITVKNYYISPQINIVYSSVLPTLSINDVTLTEGNSGTTNAIFTVTRAGTATQGITVNYATANGTAIAGSDYTTTSGALSFATNETTKTISVPILGDTTVEANETFLVNLSSPTNATLTDAQGQGTITNDDTATSSTVTLSLNYSGISENSPSNFTYTFTRTGSLTNALTVNFNVTGTTTLGTDYTQTGATSFTNTTGTVTFAANSATATLVINPTGDTIIESNETVALTLTTGTGYAVGTAIAIAATIINDDSTRRQIATNGHDVILGANKPDVIIGGLGNDSLTGGVGGDLFTFQATNEGIDRITDFTPTDDLIVVKGSSFGGGLISGDILQSTQFIIGTAATTTTHRFIYNSSTGALLFDKDGTGATAAIQLATLNTGLALTYEDIFVS